MGRRRASESSATLWANVMLGCTLGSGNHVDVNLTCTIYLNIIADQVHTIMAAIFLNSSALFQQDNLPWHTEKTVQEWFEEHDKEFDLASKFYRSPFNQSNLSVGCAEEANLIHGGLISQLTGL